nr:MAG TPA: hypothetical protein [Caudoviricetes sp.]
MLAYNYLYIAFTQFLRSNNCINIDKKGLQ